MIKRATLDDFKAVYDMAEAYHKEYRAKMKHAPFGFEWQKCASQLYKWLQADTSINYIADHAPPSRLARPAPAPHLGSHTPTHPRLPRGA